MRDPMKFTKVNIHTSLHDMADDWKALEKTGIATPYQTWAWTKAWVDTLGPSSGLKPHFISIADENGAKQIILPLGLSKSPLGTKAIFLGGKHSNFNMMVTSQTAFSTLTASDLEAFLKEAAQKCGIDCYHFIHQPVIWKGLNNPLLKLPHTPSANIAYRADLLPDGDAMIKSLMSSESRKKLRNKEKRLGELGAITFKKATEPQEIERVINAFLMQKAARFNHQGIDNPFATAQAEAFLRQGSQKANDTEAPFIFYYLSAGERIISILGAAEHDDRVSGMITSFDASPEIIRYSPGDLLLLKLVQYLADEKYEVFDLGTGDATYKGDYCKLEEILFDSILPMTNRGKLLAKTLEVKSGVKRWIKQNPTALKLARRIR
jgi:CelD/BcsL family acetyltransferase involved in cellulose biosynthesis